jgi:NAD(P)-dependent dehydrogenase (short-subunit alcohol dehydrogenase family)
VAKDWGAKDVPDLHGLTALVTGANSGIGFFTALELGRAGARIVAACRDPARGAEAVARWSGVLPDGSFRIESLDLADLASIRALAARVYAEDERIDILVNNAGVMAVPQREVTADGFERQFGTNHLGHFALTALLAPALRRSRAPRVVTVSSSVASVGRVNLHDLQSERRYSPWRAYSASKLANLLYMLELGRRAPWVTSVAAHPGLAPSNLQRHMGPASTWMVGAMGQRAEIGALPSLYAATGDVRTGEYYGPRWLFHLRGSPARLRLPGRALDADAARALWDESERLTGTRFDIDGAR